MSLKPAVAILAAFAFVAQTQAQGNVSEPEGYRTDDYRAPVPATLAGVRVLTTAEAETIWRTGTGIFIDVLPRAPKPANLPAGTIWRDKPRRHPISNLKPTRFSVSERSACRIINRSASPLEQAWAGKARFSQRKDQGWPQLM